MGTKRNPGRFDCYAAALPDEPMFVLLGRDESAPLLVSIWACLRAGDVLGARSLLNELTLIEPERPEEQGKAEEALLCARQMLDWRRANDGAWRQPLAPVGPSIAGSRIRLLELSSAGTALLEVDGEREHRHVYTGARAVCLGTDPFDPNRFLVTIDAGGAELPGEINDAVMFRISLPGLRAMASDLVQTAEAADGARAVDIRQVL